MFKKRTNGTNVIVANMVGLGLLTLAGEGKNVKSTIPHDGGVFISFT